MTHPEEMACTDPDMESRALRPNRQVEARSSGEFARTGHIGHSEYRARCQPAGKPPCRSPLLDGHSFPGEQIAADCPYPARESRMASPARLSQWSDLPRVEPAAESRTTGASD